MASTIVTKNSSTASAVPLTGDLTQGELAVNVTDKRLFTKNSGGTVVELGINPSSLTMSGGTANGVAYLNGSKVVTTGSALTFDGSKVAIATAGNDQLTWSAAGKTGYLYVDGAGVGIGDTALLAGNNTYYNKTSNYIANYINGSEQMRLTSTGLGIGTSSPAYKLSVYGTDPSIGIQANAGTADDWRMQVMGSDNRWRLYNNTSGYGEILTVSRTGNLGLGVTPSTILDIGANNSTPKTISLRYSTVPAYLSNSYDGSVGLTTLSCNSYNTSNGSATWSAFANTGYGNAAFQLTASTTGSDIRFLTAAAANTNPTERARIDSSGNLYVYSSVDGVVSASSLAAGTSNNIFLGKYSATSTTTGTTCYAVRTNGNVINTNNSYGAISDSKLKDVIGVAPSYWDKFKQYQFVNYTLKSDETKTKLLGLVAQQAEQVSPGVVEESPDRDADGNDLGTTTKGVKYSVVTLQAEVVLQEAQARIEQLESVITQLTERITALEGN